MPKVSCVLVAETGLESRAGLRLGPQGARDGGPCLAASDSPSVCWPQVRAATRTGLTPMMPTSAAAALCGYHTSRGPYSFSSPAQTVSLFKALLGLMWVGRSDPALVCAEILGTYCSR